jgi:AraC-like DNA-binding protein
MLAEFFYVCSGFMGLVTFFTMLLHFKTNKMLNVYLALLLLFISIKFILLGLENDFTILKALNKNLRYKYLFIFFVPCTHLYLSNLIKDKKCFTRNDRKHFVIPVLIILNFSFVDLKFYHKNILFTLIFTIVLFYFFQTFKLIKSQIWNKKSEFRLVNSQKKIIEEWSVFIFILSALISLRLISTLYIHCINPTSTNDNPFQMFSVLFFDVALIKIIISPELLYGYKTRNKKTKNLDNLSNKLNDLWTQKPTVPITNSQDKLLHEKINSSISSYCLAVEKLFFSTKILRDPKITLSEISKTLDIPKSHLTFIFKYYSKVNYSEFKKIVRVYDSFHLIETGFLKTNTLESLCTTVGFTSYNPFYITFKEVSGITPQMYSKDYMD